MRKISISGLPVSESLKAGVLTNTIFESGNVGTDSLKAEIPVLGCSELARPTTLVPAAISKNFFWGSKGHGYISASGKLMNVP